MNPRPKRRHPCKVATSEGGISKEEHHVKEASSSISKPRKRAAPKMDANPKPIKRCAYDGMLKAVITDLSVEVVDTIVDLLDPDTLINLSRTNSLFRNRLLSSDHFWRSARQNAGMPELTAPDITQRQYILLVFDKHCHNCYKPNVQEINFVNCARLCSSCRAETRITLVKYRNLLHPKTLQCAKQTDDASWMTFVPTVQLPGFRIPRGFYKLSRKLQTLTGPQLDCFVAERTKLKEQIKQDGESILRWLKDQAKKKYAEECALKKSRRQSIKQRLLDIGWSDQTLVGNWDCHKEVHQPHELTPAIWKRIQVPLVKKLRRSLIYSRNGLRFKALSSIYYFLYDQDARTSLFPSRNVFFELSPVKVLWWSDFDVDPAPAIELQEFSPFAAEEWDAALPAITAAVTKYQDEMEQLALRRLSAGYAAHGLPVPDDVLNDPRSFFRYSPPDGGHSLPPEDDIVLPFPAIHQAMRDRQNSAKLEYQAAEFSTVKVGARSNGMTCETLAVFLFPQSIEP